MTSNRAQQIKESRQQDQETLMIRRERKKQIMKIRKERRAAYRLHIDQHKDHDDLDCWWCEERASALREQKLEEEIRVHEALGENWQFEQQRHLPDIAAVRIAQGTPETVEWLSALVMGKFHSNEGLCTRRELVRMLSSMELVVIPSQNPHNISSVSDLVVIVVPCLAVRADGKLIRNENGRRIYLPRFCLLSSEEGLLAVRLRRQKLVDILVERQGVDYSTAEELVIVAEDEISAWHDGCLSLGDLRPLPLGIVKDMLLKATAQLEKLEEEYSTLVSLPTRSSNPKD
ncbi:MAG: hypothetical protein PHN19_03600 [Patescibacteria group bacterium]|nr:hypothetical protein [Patescibacteria group bacterium]